MHYIFLMFKAIAISYTYVHNFAGSISFNLSRVPTHFVAMCSRTPNIVIKNLCSVKRPPPLKIKIHVFKLKTFSDFFSFTLSYAFNFDIFTIWYKLINYSLRLYSTFFN